MTDHTHETEIVVDPDVPLVRITRVFDAPPEKVFRAHVEPELFAQWNGPRGTDMKVDVFDCRTGGSYRYLITREGFEAGFRGCFHEVRPSELIVQTFTFEGVPDGVALERLVFEDLGDGRTRLGRDLARRLVRRPRRLRRERHGGRGTRRLRTARRAPRVGSVTRPLTVLAPASVPWRRWRPRVAANRETACSSPTSTRPSSTART